MKQTKNPAVLVLYKWINKYPVKYTTRLRVSSSSSCRTCIWTVINCLEDLGKCRPLFLRRSITTTTTRISCRHRIVLLLLLFFASGCWLCLVIRPSCCSLLTSGDEVVPVFVCVCVCVGLCVCLGRTVTTNHGNTVVVVPLLYFFAAA